MPQKIIDTIHNLYVHDDEALNSLPGTALADLWQCLVLYQYGGIYADINSAPGHLFQNGMVIVDDNDAWFVVERIGTLSQYFMALSTKHLLMH
jgi:mannosyltransferase OCH1-like enzyme